MSAFWSAWPEALHFPVRALARTVSCLEAIQADPKRLMVLDIETTGLDADEDVLSLAIVDGTGRTVYQSRFGAVRKASWPEAQRVNHIAPEAVKGLPAFPSCAGRVTEILAGADVIAGYNHINFDMRYLIRDGVRVPEGVRYCDVMSDFWDCEEYYPGHTLEACADYCGCWDLWKSGAHTSAGDCLTTLRCLKVLALEERNSEADA